MTPRLRLIAMLVSSALLATACGTAERPELVAAAEAAEADVGQGADLQPATPSGDLEPTPVPTSTPRPTATPAPTATIVPTAVPTVTPVPTATTAPTPRAVPTAPATPPAATADPHVVHEQSFAPMAITSNLTLHFPAAEIELVGFHESGHDGSQQMDLIDPDVQAVTLSTRNRLTGSRTAADIVVPPDAEIRSPITGTVISAGTYVLYCEYSDDFLLIAPDGQPGWEVKIFHIDGVQPAKGDRVEAGVTVIAPRATQLPFESQVDAFTAEPSWPHVHVEVVDPSIPDVNKTGGGSC